MTQDDIDVFVSHRGVDDAWVRMFVGTIEGYTIEDECGTRYLRTFYAPRDLAPGRPIDEEIIKNAKRARFVALIMTPEFFESPFTSKEVNAVLGEDKLIPILLRDESLQGQRLTDLPFLVRDWKFLDFRQSAEFESQMSKLIEHVRAPAREPQRMDFSAWLSPILKILGPARPMQMLNSTTANLQPFPSLERAFDHVVDRLGLVVSDGCPREPLGCAWWWRDNRLLCASPVGEVVEENLLAGRRVEIGRVRPGEYRNVVEEVREAGFPHLAVLRVYPSSWIPKSLAMTWSNAPCIAAGAEAVGALALQRRQGGGLSHPMLVRVLLNGGTVGKLDCSAEIVPGTPVFDRFARLVGFILSGEALELSVKPFLTRP